MRPHPHALLWCLGLGTALLAGPATAARPGGRVVKETHQPGVVFVKETRQPGVRIVGETSIEEAEAPVVPPEEVIPLPDPDREIEQKDPPVEETPDAEATRNEAWAQALGWATKGLLQYERHEYEAAHESLKTARLMLFDADLPDDMESQGLGALRSSLPEELQRHDVEAIALDLDRTIRTSLAEPEERALVEREARRILAQLDKAAIEEQYFEILVDETHHVVDFFQGPRREFFERAFTRKHKYWPGIQEVFTAKNIPPDLAYMALVESGFDPRAVSSQNARGLWQFMPPTGLQYGLESPEDFYDVGQSTVSAATYLRELINIFGSYLLAAAAYNAGEGKIQGCLRRWIDRLEERSFWEIRGCLKKETQEYVPRILAAAVIGADPKSFGFDLLSEEEMLQLRDVVIVPDVTPLAHLADLTGTDVASLRRDNTELAERASTPGRNFPLYVPQGWGPRLLDALELERRPPKIAPMGPIETVQP